MSILESVVCHDDLLALNSLQRTQLCEEIRQFLVEKVSAALEENNEKPIFVITHFPIDRTLCGTQTLTASPRNSENL